MSLSNREIAEIFENVADMMEIKGENIHRILSYRRAAETISEQVRDLAAIAAESGLTELPGIGKTIADKINEMLTTGQLEFYERLKKDVPEGVMAMKRINGVGPKKAKLFWDELNITSVDALKEAAEAGKLRDLPRMGAKSEQKILDGIAALERQTGRTRIGKARPTAERIMNYLLELPEALQGEIAGSIRRGRETIGDVDILIASDHPEPIMARFVAMQEVARVLGHGSTKSSIELHSGLQVDLRILEKARWGTALQYFSGSQAHNVRVREIALAHGYSLNEHALRPIDSDGNLIDDESGYVYCATEAEVYERIGLAWVPPELREDSGEIEAAQNGTLPELITLADIRGDLHMHTNASDGRLSIREMAEAARERGRSYIVITDHSQFSSIANGLSVERLMLQAEEVRRVNADMGDEFQVLHGTEMDIRPDGTLDYPDEVLEKLDFVVASLHYSLTQDREQITQRLLNAINNPHVDLIGHPSARYIEDRPPVDADWDAVFNAAAATSTALEINANPRRLDLSAQFARRAISMGIPLAINTDAHTAGMMDTMLYGVLTARRGWVEAGHVLNAWPFEKFRDWVDNRSR